MRGLIKTCGINNLMKCDQLSKLPKHKKFIVVSRPHLNRMFAQNFQVKVHSNEPKTSIPIVGAKAVTNIGIV